MQRNLKGENGDRERERRDPQIRYFSPFFVAAIFSASRSKNITSSILSVKKLKPASKFIFYKRPTWLSQINLHVSLEQSLWKRFWVYSISHTILNQRKMQVRTMRTTEFFVTNQPTFGTIITERFITKILSDLGG
jgi:hypothetical protein